MKTNKLFLLLAGVILLLIFLIIFIISWRNFTKELENNSTIPVASLNNQTNTLSNLAPSAPAPTLITPSQEQLEEYLRLHISELSPEPEVLGGKFYVTKITWTNSRSANVEYEDGHIALIGDVKFKEVSSDTPVAQQVIVEYFKVLK